jgi:thioredoxin-related protein
MRSWILLMSVLLFGCSPPVAVESAVPAGEAIKLDTLLDRAKKENKAVLLEFTGSDWCPPCMQLKREVIATGAFQDYAKTNLIFVEVDFPRTKPQSAAERTANDALQQRFQIEAFPTLVLVDSAGDSPP